MIHYISLYILYKKKDIIELLHILKFVSYRIPLQQFVTLPIYT